MPIFASIYFLVIAFVVHCLLHFAALNRSHVISTTSSMTSSISFNINGTSYTANSADTPVDTTLNTFIRDHANLTGTKLMCNEGGCGVCIVSIKRVHPFTNKLDTTAVNSCLMPLFSCHNVDITTIEGVGNKTEGYCPEQTRLWKANGSQCGMCSPGMIMNMHSLLESKAGTATMKEIENSFGGNICRCTGYRPILDAFKSLAVDADNTLLCHDIEELPKMCTGTSCEETRHANLKESLYLKFIDGGKWYKVHSITEILQTLVRTTEEYMLVAGNTAHGVYRRSENVKLFIDVNDVPELRSHSVTDNELVLGANNTLAETQVILESVAETSGFEYCSQLANHIEMIATVPVRNIGTIAGNLSIKRQHNRFPSDMFVILEAVGAKLTIINANDDKKTIVDLVKYLTMDMRKKVIVNVRLPMLPKTFFRFKTYKVMARAQNCHAYVNAAFLLKFNSNNVESASICFGGIHPKFTHATDTEIFLRGKKPYTNETLQLAIKVLNNEIKPDEMIGDASPEYRKRLAVSLFYKFILNTSNEKIVKPEHRSGANTLNRVLSSGTQTYETKEEKFPLTEPIPKYGGLEQVSGEAMYTNDIPHFFNELWAAFVPATKVRSRIAKIDATEALKMRGVRKFFSALDIPGNNSFTPTSSSFIGIVEPEEIFVGHKSPVLFYGQPVGIILAETFHLAKLAATKVKISYLEDDSYVSMARTMLNPWLGEEKPIQPTIQDVFRSKGKFRPLSQATDSKVKDANKTITGRFEMGSQYHMHMELQSCVCTPSEYGMTVYSSTQWTDCLNVAISECLNVPANSIHIEVKRVGGAFGGKLSRSSQIACACAIACHHTRVPVRFVLSIESNMNVVGKRNAMIGEYTINVGANGKVVKLDAKIAHVMGCSMNESPRLGADFSYPNCYDASSWKIDAELVKTDAPSMTWCRAPGTTESIAMAEIMMEHISKVMDKDPMAVRIANLAPDSLMNTLYPKFVKDVDFNNRKNKNDEFNRRNRWNKKGIAIVPMKYPFLYIDSNTAYVSVYHNDGTVIVSHGGIAIGQGINTKVVQVAAHILGISHSLVKVRPTNNVIGANCALTGGSVTSEMVCSAVTKACEEINKRLKPIRDSNKDAQWIEIARAAYANQISLSALSTVKAMDLKTYVVWGLSCADIEIDLLTGNILVHRVDILEDAGQSMNPLIDIGQIEGAYVMGMGLWLTESLIYNRENGELLTNRTWNYKPPGAKDIPVDFRIKLLQSAYNPGLILGSKGVGEPALAMSIAVNLALRNALQSARNDAGIKNDPWFHLPTPTTPEVICLTAGHSIDSFTL